MHDQSKMGDSWEAAMKICSSLAIVCICVAIPSLSAAQTGGAFPFSTLIKKVQAGACYDTEARAQCKANCSNSLRTCQGGNPASSSCDARYSACVSGCPPQVCAQR